MYRHRYRSVSGKGEGEGEGEGEGGRKGQGSGSGRRNGCAIHWSAHRLRHRLLKMIEAQITFTTYRYTSIA